MRSIVKLLTLGFTLAAFPAFAVTLNFDDITTLFTDLASISPYNGLNFTNYTSYDDTVNFDGYPNGIVSPHVAIFSGGEVGGANGNTEITGTFAPPTPSTFTLNTAYLGAAHRDGQQVLVLGVNGASTVFSETLTLTTSGAQLFTFNEPGLTSVSITPIAGTGSDTFDCGSFNCTQFTLDNLEINDPIPSGAPEPATIVLTTAGLGLALLSRRRHS